MKTKLTLFVALLAAALFMGGCASTDTSGNQKTTKPEEPKEPAFLKEGLVAYYPFNGNAKDASGNGNDGEVIGATDGRDRHGILVSSLTFGGTSDRVSLPHKLFNGMHGLTFTAWINLETSKKSQALLSLANEKSDNAFLLMFGDQDGREGPLRLWSIGINGDFIDAEVIARVPPNTLVNRWSHITVAHNNLESTIKVYVDGNLDQEVNCKINRLVVLQNGAFIGQDQDHVGGGFNSNQAFKGSIDDVRIYNRALSAEEVKALYDLEKPKGK